MRLVVVVLVVLVVLVVAVIVVFLMHGCGDMLVVSQCGRDRLEPTALAHHDSVCVSVFSFELKTKEAYTRHCS